MPPQQRFGPDEQPVPARAGQQPRQAGQHRPVGPVEPRPGDLAAQHRDLVAQHRQRKPPQHLAEQQVEQSKGHVPIIAARQLFWRTRSSAPTTDFLPPTGKTPGGTQT
jgi:hypothetical protein